MLKTELVDRLYESHLPYLLLPDCQMAVNVIMEAIADAVTSGRRCEFRDFGVFRLRYIPARTYLELKYGNGPVSVPAQFKIHFKPTGELMRRVYDSRKAI